MTADAIARLLADLRGILGRDTSISQRYYALEDKIFQASRELESADAARAWMPDEPEAA